MVINNLYVSKTALLYKREGRREKERKKRKGEKKTPKLLPPEFPILHEALKYCTGRMGCTETLDSGLP